MFVVGYKLDQTLLYTSGVYSQNEPNDNVIIQNMINSRGGISSDYSIFRIDDNSIPAKRISNGDEFNLSWSESVPNGTISGIDFLPEDSKPLIKFYAVNGKTEILANNMDNTDVKIEIWNSTKSGIETTVDGVENIKILTPQGVAEVICRFQNGECLLRIRTDLFGTWVFPADSKRFLNYRIYNTLTIKSLVPFV